MITEKDKAVRVVWQELPILDILAVFLALVSLFVTILLTRHVKRHVKKKYFMDDTDNDHDDIEEDIINVQHVRGLSINCSNCQIYLPNDALNTLDAFNASSSDKQDKKYLEIYPEISFFVSS